MKIIRSSWFLFSIAVIIIIILISRSMHPAAITDVGKTDSSLNKGAGEWQAPDTNSIPASGNGNLIKYGKELIVHTANYLGQNGSVAQISNGMNCQNCHINGGTVAFGNSFAAVASTYPKFRERSGKVETIEFRINECMERSLNGKPLDSNSKEMRAMVQYFLWIGKDVPKNVKPKGAGTEELPYLPRAADTAKGRIVYVQKCTVCHGKNGEGILSANGIYYVYPPLWGNNSYNVSAGMYRLSRLAGFVKNNMPYGATYKNPQLTNEEAWDVAAFVNSRPRVQKMFSYDWPNIATKPVDHPFGPYTDGFTEAQHKYGPFEPIKKKKLSNK